MIGASRLLSVAEPSARSAGCSEANQAKRRSDRSGLQPRHIAACAQAVSQCTESSKEGKEVAHRQHVCGLLDTSYGYFEFGTGNLLATITKKALPFDRSFRSSLFVFCDRFLFLHLFGGLFPCAHDQRVHVDRSGGEHVVRREAHFLFGFLEKLPGNHSKLFVRSCSSHTITLL